MAVTRRRTLWGIAAAAVVPLVFLALGCAEQPVSLPRVETVFRGPALGTSYQVKVITTEELPPARQIELESALVDEIEFVNARMSTYLPDSELSRFNTSESTQPYAVSAETADVVRAALEISRNSGGALDVTVGPLVELWGFGAAGRRTEPPDPAEVERVRGEVGWEHVQVEGEALRKAKPGLRVDLSAIAKGYAVDRVAEFLGSRGLADHMVEIGGEIRVAGRNVSGEPWRLAIEKPDPAARAVHTVLPLADVAMATSGNYRNFFEWDGTTYAHTIDPRTGWPAKHELASVTVLAPTCMLADGYATALMVLGLDEGLAFANRAGVATMLLTLTPDGDVEEHPSKTWAQALATAPPAGASQ